MDTLPLYKYIEIGQRLTELRFATYSLPTVTREAVSALETHLPECKFPHSQMQLSSIGALLGMARSQNAISEIVGLAHQLQMLVLSESRERLLVEIDRTASPRLYDLPKQQKLTESQLHLWEETIRCLERQAYRAAIVMAWALGYDIVRFSIWNDSARLSELVKSAPPKLSLDTSDYEMFILTTTSERQFLEVASTAHLLGPKSGRTFDTLAGFLRERNEFAHANDRIPTAVIANGFVERLLAIVGQAPFAIPLP
jgi:hypothetical protein